VVAAARERDDVIKYWRFGVRDCFVPVYFLPADVAGPLVAFIDLVS